MTTFKTSREIPTTPAELFAAISDPARLARWWGPNGFTNNFQLFEFRQDGKWIFTMIGPDGKTYPNESKFETIEPSRKVVIRHLSLPQFTLTISLNSTTTGTWVDWEQVLDDSAVADAIRHIIEPANEQNLDRITAEVQRQ